MLDDIDRSVLYALHLDARKPVSELARECGLTREVVDYRLRKLQREGILKGFIARINQSYFCEGVGTLLMKCSRSDEQRFREAVAFLQGHRAVNWMAELCGTYDLVITLLYRDVEDLANTIAKMAESMRGVLRQHDLSLYIDEYKFAREGIIRPDARDRLAGKSPIRFRAQNRHLADLDATDIAILSLLAEDARKRNVDIAKAVGLSEDAVRLRIRRLEEREVIFGYTAVLDLGGYGLEEYYVGIHLEQMTAKAAEGIRDYARKNPFIGYCVRSAGKYDLVMSLYARNRAHFGELLVEIRSRLGAQLAGYEFQLIMKELKEVYITPEFLKGEARRQRGKIQRAG